ncbi:MAG TPA: metallopeptidase family protein [Thermohalobaculum sp.]|nr:metallopeptidase family protein [Thermohalobaculum sp.]
MAEPESGGARDILSVPAPSLADFEALADRARAALPDVFREMTGALLVRVDDFADEETLAELDIEDPFELTGLYQGVALTEKSVLDVPVEPDVVWLYRRPILDEWVERGDVPLDRLVAHVLVHEIAHHFGWSDERIAEIDDWRL